MSFNVFGPATKNDIRIGYISPDLGYITNVSICEANQYAYLNPGAIFILETRSKIRFININEVNKLTPEDILPDNSSSTSTCEGIVGLSPNDSGTVLKSGDVLVQSQSNILSTTEIPSFIYFSGGGGVGAVANPIFGRDGSLLAIDLIRGGFGYQYAPRVKLVDPLRRGSGAVIRSIVGTAATTLEYYDTEEDFEIYDFSLCGEDIAGYGNRFGVNGENLGEWDPTLFATLIQDPIRQQIQEYQDFLQSGINPFWHTRKEIPISVTFRDKTDRVKHDVTNPAWDENFMNKYAVSPVPMSNVPGSDFAGRWCTFEWEENFPYTGEYTFRGMGDNIVKLYFDNEFLFETTNFIGGPKDTLKKTIQEGVHRIKVDLYNVPIKEKVLVPLVGCDTNEIIFRITTSADYANKIEIPELGINFGKEYKGPQLNETVTKTVEFGKEYDVIIKSPESKSIKLRTQGESVLQVEESTDNDWQDLICSASCGKFIKINGNRCKFVAIEKPKLQSTTPSSSQSFGSIFNTLDYVDKANRKLWRTNVYGKGGFLGEYGVCPFDTKNTLKDNPYAGTHIILWEGINFPADGNYNIDIEVDDSVTLFIGNSSADGKKNIGNGLIDVNQGGDEVIIEKKGFIGNSDKGTGKTSYTRFFKRGKYRIRAELYQKPGGRFGFDPGTTTSSNANISARFSQDGGDIYLVVDGSGSADLDFSLKVDDNPRVKGDSLGSLKIGNLIMKRTREKNQYKEKETVKGQGNFTGGQRYKVEIKGASSGVGAPRVNSNSIQFLDAGGTDTNAELILNKIKNVQSAPIKGINPMALAVNITASSVETTVISPKTFNQNPMGAAITIDAPLPPIPQEPIPIGEGRCPNNPIWTSRFPGSSEKWWPVSLDQRWSDFMNRFAISPIPPLSTPNSDGGGGKVYSTTWNLDIPYNGFYGIKGTCDNWGRILIDGNEVYKLRGFKTISPPLSKFFLAEGNHTITVEVENQKTLKYNIITKKVFSTKDWAVPRTGGEVVDVDFKVTSDAKFANTVELVGEFSYSKTYDGPQINESTTRKIEVGKVYDVIFSSNKKVNSSSPHAIKYNGLNSTNNPINVSSNGKEIRLKDSSGDDINSRITIDSTSGGNARFTSDGKGILVDGKKVTIDITFSWDDNINTAGRSVQSFTIGSKTWSITDSNRGFRTQSIILDNTSISGSIANNNSNIILRSSGDGVVKMEDHTDNDFTDIIIRATKGKFYEFNGNRCKYVIGSPAVQESVKTQGGVTYSGPEIFRYKHNAWSTFMNENNVSPYLPPLNVTNDNILGTKTFTWTNVNFFENGQYIINFQADNVGILYINGVKTAESRSFRGTTVPTYVNLSAGNYEIKVELENIPTNDNSFNTNPTGFSLIVLKEVKIATQSKPWTDNPVGVSAILIPPPCPKVVEGKGTVIDVIVDEPGNGYPQPTGEGYPVTLQLVDVIPQAKGINYSPGEPIIITGGRGPNDRIEIVPELGNFGTVERIPVPRNIPGTTTPTLIGFTNYPNITLPSATGIGFRGTPVFRPVIVPTDVLPDDQIIQVTDLVGLKQTGYVNGKPYYGSVFYKDGVRYAGIYETVGELIQVYDTLQESIDAEVTTRPSAILKQGTDISSNDPKLNIPGTPENLI